MPAPRLSRKTARRPLLSFLQLEDRVTPTLCCGDFLTYTQGGWGAVPNGNNPGTYLHANFAGAFPTGVQIGDQTANAATTNNTAGHWAAYFSSASVITTWLPHTGPSGALGGDTVDPVGEPDNDDGTLAGQTLALMLNLGFDDYDPAFSPSATDMSSLVVTSGPFAGKTAQFVLDTCNAILAGVTTTGYTAAQANEAATAINENFDNGSANGGTDNGFLDCDCDVISVTIGGAKFVDADGDLGTLVDQTGRGGWTIYINGPDGLHEVTTAADGSWTYEITAAGEYTITENLPDGWTQLGGIGSYTVVVSADGDITSGSETGNVFYNFENICLSGTKWEDHDGDGVRDAGDGGLAGWHILINGVDRATTDAAGNWSVCDLGPGEYTIQEVNQSGWTQTYGNAGYTVAARSGEDVGDNDFGNFENVTLTGVKFYDADANATRNGAEPVIAGWKVTLTVTSGPLAGNSYSTYTDATGAYTFGDLDNADNDNNPLTGSDLGPNTAYTISEGTQTNWVATTVSSFIVTVGGDGVQSGGAAANDFGNVKLGATGGFTLGYWSNKNGQAVLAANDSGDNSWRIALNSLNLRKADGSDFVVPTGPGVTFATAYGAFRSWILSATATNMAYMLSAQLAATTLDVLYKGLSADTMIHVPTLAAWAGNTQGANLATNLGGLVSATGFVRLGDITAAANTLLGTNGNIPAGDGVRLYAEALKIVCDGVNNSLSIATVGLSGPGGWNDANHNGVMESGELGTWTTWA